jgi:hypothetical protein
VEIDAESPAPANPLQITSTKPAAPRRNSTALHHHDATRLLSAHTLKPSASNATVPPPISTDDNKSVLQMSLHNTLTFKKVHS